MKEEQLRRDTDHYYRWNYSMNLWKNPTVIVTVAKILLIAGSVPVLLMTFLTFIDEGLSKALSTLLDMSVLMGLILLGLLIIGYVLIALINGGTYQVVFEMNEYGIKHIQMQRQFKKNQILALLTILAGAAAGNPQAAGAGLLAGSKQSTYSNFSKVKKIRIKSSSHVIYMSEWMSYNQIYTTEEQFEFIKDYIINRCPKAVVIGK